MHSGMGMIIPTPDPCLMSSHILPSYSMSHRKTKYMKGQALRQHYRKWHYQWKLFRAKKVHLVNIFSQLKGSSTSISDYQLFEKHLTHASFYSSNSKPSKVKGLLGPRDRRGLYKLILFTCKDYWLNIRIADHQCTLGCHGKWPLDVILLISCTDSEFLTDFISVIDLITLWSEKWHTKTLEKSHIQVFFQLNWVSMP